MPHRTKRSRRYPTDQPSRAPRFNVVEPVAWNRLTPGAIVLADIPYQDASGSKRRPAIVAQGRHHGSIEVLGLYSSRQLTKPFAVVRDFASAGLSRESFVALDPVAVERRDVVTILGELGERDAWILDDPAVSR